MTTLVGEWGMGDVAALALGVLLLVGYVLRELRIKVG